MLLLLNFRLLAQEKDAHLESKYSQKKNMTRLLKSIFTVLTYDLINFYSETARCWQQMPLWIQRIMFYCFAIILKFLFFFKFKFHFIYYFTEIICPRMPAWIQGNLLAIQRTGP
jgi:hypothetical protein